MSTENNTAMYIAIAAAVSAAETAAKEHAHEKTKYARQAAVNNGTKTSPKRLDGVTRRMTVKEFKLYCDAVQSDFIAFSSKGQEWGEYAPMEYSMGFTSIAVSYNTSVVFLRGEQYSTMKFSRVKYVEVTQYGNAFDLVSVVCEDLFEREETVNYNFLMKI